MRKFFCNGLYKEVKNVKEVFIVWCFCYKNFKVYWDKFYIYNFEKVAVDKSNLKNRY